MKLVTKALEYSKLKKGDIDDIVLVGGSSKMPKVNRMLEAYFSGKVNTAMNFRFNPVFHIAIEKHINN